MLAILTGALVVADELPGGTVSNTQSEGDGGNVWESGLCAKAFGPAPLARVSRRFVEHAGDLDHAPVDVAFWIESILVFAPGQAEEFMTALRESAMACRTELQAAGYGFFCGDKQFPRIRNEAQVCDVEPFGCCATPLPMESDRPHDIVYIRDGNIVLHVYGTGDALIEVAARLLEDHIDGVASSTQ